MYFDEVKKNFGFGCMRLPMIENGKAVDIEQTKKMVDTFIEQGFNYFDTAHGYLEGKSELALKECLTSRHKREEYILTDKLTMTYFLIGMMIPVHCVLIPLFIQFSKIGLSNTLLGIIIPYITFSLPITIYILVGFFAGIPRELFEAACIDGCSVYRMFTHVALPLAKTGFMVTGLMSFVANWNELLLAMVFISKEAKKTLPVSLTKFVGPYNTNYCQMFAAIVLAIIPTVVVYCCFSNNIVDGLTQGAVKG